MLYSRNDNSLYFKNGRYYMEIDIELRKLELGHRDNWSMC